MFYVAPATVPAQAGIHGGHILGTLGTGGAALAATVVLVLGVRARGRIKFTSRGAAITGFVAGVLYGAAGQQIWDTPGSITTSVTQSVQGTAALGNVGLGAVATIMAVLIYHDSLKPRVNAVLGIAAATVAAGAGGLWAIFSTVVASGVGQVLGTA